jgi:uncharacterized membrane protein YccC
MSQIATSPEATEDLLRKTLNMACVFARAARNQRWKPGADVAMANALRACDHALELLELLPVERRESLRPEVVRLNGALENYR